MIIILIIIALIILALGVFLYKILREETANIAEDKQKEEEERKRNRKITYMELISKNGFDAVVENIKNKPEEIDKLKSEIQSALRNASKTGNANQAREYNELLKKLDQIL